MTAIAEADGHGQIEQDNGQLGVHGEKPPYGGFLLLQVWVELLYEVPENGPGHPESLQPQLVCYGGMDDVKSPVLAGQIGP